MIPINLFVHIVYHGKYLIRQKIHIEPNRKYTKISPEVIAKIREHSLKNEEERMRYSVY